MTKLLRLGVGDETSLVALQIKKAEGKKGTLKERIDGSAGVVLNDIRVTRLFVVGKKRR